MFCSRCGGELDGNRDCASYCDDSTPEFIVGGYCYSCGAAINAPGRKVPAYINGEWEEVICQGHKNE